MAGFKCLYVHDHIFKINNSSHYSEGRFTDEVFKRYVNETGLVDVICRKEKIDNTDGFNKITLKNISFRPVVGIDFKRVFTIYLFHNFKLALRLIKKSDFLVVRLPSFLGVFVLFLNLLIRRKYFIEMVGDADEALLQSKSKVNFIFKIFVKLFGCANLYFVRRASGVIYVTKNSLQKKYVTNGIQAYASNVEVIVEEKEFKLSFYEKKNDFFKVGIIGSYNNNYKGIDVAIKMLRLLKEKNIFIDLHILGSGRLKSHYLLLAEELDVKDRVYFDGILPNGNLVNTWLDSLDIYMQPSRTEGLPRALIEAMARGLPAIATDVGGIPELLNSDFLVKPGRSESLASKLELLLSSQDLRYSEGVRNYLKSKEYDYSCLKKKRRFFWDEARCVVSKNI